jgi:hypothetical protein
MLCRETWVLPQDSSLPRACDVAIDLTSFQLHGKARMCRITALVPRYSLRSVCTFNFHATGCRQYYARGYIRSARFDARQALRVVGRFRRTKVPCYTTGVPLPRMATAWRLSLTRADSHTANHADVIPAIHTQRTHVRNSLSGVQGS